MSTLEAQTIIAWKRWGSSYAMSTTCSSCREVKNCRGKRRSKMLCLACFDLKESS